MKRLVTAALAAILATAALPAVAANLSPSPASPVMPTAIPAYAFSWTGPYAGLTTGYRWADVKPGGSANTFVGGVYGGYNYQLGNGIVAGVEADVLYGRGRDRDLGFTFRQDWEGSARARVGYAFDRFLPFITGGVAFTSVDAQSAAGKSSKTLTGWTAGAGVEYALTDNVSLRTEYRYADYGKTNFGLAGVPKTGVDDQSLRFGLGYKF